MFLLKKVDGVNKLTAVFSMVYTRIDRKMMSKNVQNSSGMGNFFFILFNLLHEIL